MPDELPILCRRLRLRDAVRLGAFFNRNNRVEIVDNFTAFPLTEEMAPRLLRPECRDLFFGALVGDDLVGFSMLRGWDDGFEVPSFGIFTDYTRQGRGVGRRLTAWTVRWAERMGCPRTRLTVNESNRRAYSIYSRLGFRVTDRLREAGGRSRLVMHKDRAPLRTCVYVSTNSLPAGEPFAARLNNWRDHGMFGIECGNYPGLSRAMAVCAVTDADGDLLFHNYFPPPQESFALNLASGDDMLRDRSMAFVRSALDLSSRARARWYACHAGFCADPIGRDAYGFRFPIIAEEQHGAALSRQVESIRELAPYARSRAVGLLIENNVCNEANRGKVLLAAPWDFEAYFRQVGAAPGVGVLFDTGHWRVSAQTLGFDEDHLEHLARHVVGVHLHDNNGSEDEHRPVCTNSQHVQRARQLHPAFATLEGLYHDLAELQWNLMEIEGVLNE